MVHGLDTIHRLNQEAAHKQMTCSIPISEKLQKDHSELVIDLAKSGHTIVEEMSSQQAHLLHMILGISGEAGELLDSIKKYVIYQKPLDIDNVIEELGDLEFYIEGLRSSLGITRNETLAHNITKLRKRYGQQYSDQAAQERADKQSERCDPCTEND